MIALLIYVLVIALVVGLIYWLVDALPVPEPMNKFVKIAVIVIGCIALILVLMQAAGVNTGLPPVR